MIAFYIIILEHGGVQPAVQTISMGGKAKFECALRRNVSWAFNEKEIKDTSVIMLGKSIEINNVQRHHGGYYYCHGVSTNDMNILGRGLLYVKGI